MKAKQFILIMLAIAICIAFAEARNSANYRVVTDVVASGGAAVASSSCNAPVNIVGQAAIGFSSSSNFQNHIGFSPTTVISGDPGGNGTPVSTEANLSWTRYE